jgi:putative tryptophan/tyrosine transport system substrate-binding protein
MKRRDFIMLLGGAAASWPIPAWAQPAERMRRIGVLMPFPADDRQAQTRLGALLQALRQLGWNDGRNVQIDIRWGAGDAEIRNNAAALVALPADVIFASGTVSMGVLAQTAGARMVPTVFTMVPDPVGTGYVDSLARPGGNATGFMLFEYSIGAKWLELLKEIGPTITRAAIVRDASISAGLAMWGALQAVAPSLGIELFPVNVRDIGEIERAMARMVGTANSGLIVTGSYTAVLHRERIITLAANYKLPAIYSARFFTTDGGLISYGPDNTEPHRRAADYIDRVLKGEKPADLPVQAPTKYELVINLKTAKALGLDVPASLLARADEVIE